jgi:hypothetical protein
MEVMKHTPDATEIGNPLNLRFVVGFLLTESGYLN